MADIHQWQNLDDFYNQHQYYYSVIVLLSSRQPARSHQRFDARSGYFRPHIDSTERQQLAALIDSYRRGEQPLLCAADAYQTLYGALS